MSAYTSPVIARMDDDYMAKFLCSLPSDARITIEIVSGRDQELMARDRPAEGRRYTNLTSGTEWFITPEGLNNLGVIAIHIHPFTIKMF